MKERIKTILLFSLAALSLFLTQKLWIQLPQNVVKALEGKETNAISYALSDMIAPNKYLLNFGNKKHTILYDNSKYNIWVNSKKVLSQVLSSDTLKTEEITKDKYLKFQEDGSIVFYFSEKINTYILAKAWDVKNPNNITDTIPNVNEIYIYLGNGDPFFVFSDKEKYIIAYDNTIDNNLLKDELSYIESTGSFDYYLSMREEYGVENDIYVPYQMNRSLPTVYVSNEITILEDDQKTQVAEKFFNKDIEYVREIVEGNGSTIYEYDNRVLKLNVNGTLEYFHALEERVAKRNLYISLSTVADFITQKISSQNGMYLSNINKIESGNDIGYRLTFKYRIRGIPVLLGNREVGDYIEIEVFNNHIKSYKLLARREIDMGINTSIQNNNMLSSLDVLDKNYDLLEKEYLLSINKTKEELGENIIQLVQGAISDISLSYYDPNLKDKNEKLIGVWAIRLNDTIYAFNAYTGNFVYER